MINFDTIPGGGLLRVPFTYVEFSNSQAEGLPSDPFTALIIGQTGIGTSVPNNVPTPVVSGQDALNKFGPCMLARMCDWFLSVNQTTPLVAIGQPLAVGAVAAKGAITITGIASGDDVYTLHVYIGGIHVPVTVRGGYNAEAIAFAVQSAIQNQYETAGSVRNWVPVSATVDPVASPGVVTLTAGHAGECGNDIDIRVNYYDGDVTPPGITVAVTPMSGGTLNPSIASAIAALGDVQYNVIVCPFNDSSNEALLEAELASRFGGIRQIEGVAWKAYRGSATDTDTFGQNGDSQLVTTLGTGIAPDPPCVWAAVAAGVAAPSLAADPARPLQTLQLTGLKPPAQADRFTWQERSLHLDSGIATYTVDKSGNVHIERMVTNYQDNTSYLDIETIYTLGYLRKSTREWIGQKYPRYKLADDSVVPAPGQAIVTPRVINAELVSLAQDWVAAGLIEDLDDYKASLVCQINASDPDRLDVLASPTLVGQFRVFAEQIQFLQSGAPALVAPPTTAPAQ